MADAAVSKTVGKPCEFESRLGHQNKRGGFGRRFFESKGFALLIRSQGRNCTKRD